TDYCQLLDRLQSEDLPRHEKRFREKLGQDTINGMAMFQSKLGIASRNIRDNIDLINKSLKGIDYNKGSYINLLLEDNNDFEVREFQENMKLALSDTLSNDEIYSEKKFIQVKEIIDRLKGREGKVDIDIRWKNKVTDVRNWFNFAASERWREDDSEKEFYPDSGGKSGGQKEKLAYTILASALSYQFGLNSSPKDSRTFRFVAIDEAFGRGSDDSTHYGLKLFEQLNLQLLIVTPLQKIHVIEDYISKVHFVHNQEGRRSLVHDLSIEEYQKKKIEKVTC
ncbi:MAG: SbcC/MukB-like Walker B domain-containing protein, partial [bacterium]